MTWYVCEWSENSVFINEWNIFRALNFASMQEFCGLGGLTESADLETDMANAPRRTLEILASCHALVYVDNKLV